MKIEGLKELEKKMKQLSNVARKEAKQEALHAGSVLVQGQATLNAPVDTGNLRSSIDFEVGSEDAVIFTPVEYAPFLEYGTSRQASQSFMRPALDNNKGNIVKLFSDTYKKYLTR